jgi:hypothetical protein
MVANVLSLDSGTWIEWCVTFFLLVHNVQQQKESSSAYLCSCPHVEAFTDHAGALASPSIPMAQAVSLSLCHVQHHPAAKLGTRYNGLSIFQDSPCKKKQMLPVAN